MGVMSGAEAVKKLAESGTGRTKLDVCAAFLRANPKCNAMHVYNHLATHAHANDLQLDGTIEKLRTLIELGSIERPEAKSQEIWDLLYEQEQKEKDADAPKIKLTPVGRDDTPDPTARTVAALRPVGNPAEEAARLAEAVRRDKSNQPPIEGFTTETRPELVAAQAAAVAPHPPVNAGPVPDLNLNRATAAMADAPQTGGDLAVTEQPPKAETLPKPDAPAKVEEKPGDKPPKHGGHRNR